MAENVYNFYLRSLSATTVTCQDRAIQIARES